VAAGGLKALAAALTLTLPGEGTLNVGCCPHAVRNYRATCSNGHSCLSVTTLANRITVGNRLTISVELFCSQITGHFSGLHNFFKLGIILTNNLVASTSEGFNFDKFKAGRLHGKYAIATWN
jgi:hypothetical protein